MTPIRPLQRDDLGDVSRLYALAMGRDVAAPSHVERFFARTLLEQPWADAEIPSLVYVEDGEVVGFLGSNVRHMRFDGEPIRMACSAHLVSHPRVRSRGVGALLLRAYLDGPQDLTITDGATQTVRRIWETLGGQTVHVCSFAFVEVFRPVALAVHRALDRGHLQRFENPVQPVAALLDALASRLAPKTFARTPETQASAEPLDPGRLVEELPVVTARLRLVPDYDEAYLSWLFDELAALGRRGRLLSALVERGRLWAELVRVDEHVAGWYVAHLRERGLCRVLQIAATERHAAAVLEHCAHRSRAAGAAALYGRVEPRLLPALAQRPCVIRFAPGQLLVHARRGEIVDSIVKGSALLTRMDGEWW